MKIRPIYVLPVLVIRTAAIAQNGVGRWGGCGHMAWGGGWLMGIVWLVVLGAIAYWIIQSLQRRDRGAGAESALDILKKRYARGEINRQEFEDKRRDLGTV